MFRTEAELDDALSEPTPQVIETLARLPGDIVFLGAAGKMGPSLARMAKRASDAAGVRRRVIAVSRFSTGGEAAFTANGVETIHCDLLDEDDVAKLPDAPNVVSMCGRKFGSTGDEGATWAVNCYLPAVVCRKYRNSRIVAFSTGNVYPLAPVAGRGPIESDPLAPVGEYGMSALGRERMFGYFSQALGVPVSVIRLNYACDLRYGVLVDLARKVLAGEPVDLAMGHFNTIWQGDANAMTLRAFAFAAVPLQAFNVTGPEVLSVRRVCEKFGERFGVAPRFSGTEADTALLSDATAGLAALGPPRVSTDTLIGWVADWVKAGGRLLNKPTHFEARDGKF
ncbi:MAG TPA: NAD-dependent epimerase/dehydratase family protein [Gemmataceae bacterium]|nr:NAD-dependent epimerase/dehydratase family protein [Gemmataceae bacterium]